MNKSRHIVHMTSVHMRHDVRIFLKECRSIARSWGMVTLIVADGRGNEVTDGVKIVDAGASHGRLDRMRNASRRVLEQALLLDADAYHFHDPELIPAGLKLKGLGKKVFFDAHEDLPKQLLGKPYLNPIARWTLSKVFENYERWACKRMDGIIAATPAIREKFLLINSETLDVNNFPMIGELSFGDIDWSLKRKEICYVGGIGKIRGIEQVVQAMARIRSGAQLQLVGGFAEKELERQLMREPGWKRVNRLGYLDRKSVSKVLEHSVAGVVTFLPSPNHVESQPNKMFEYMSAGVPVIGSNFPLWKEIIEGSGCGLCVNPNVPQEIAEAIDFLVNDPISAERMGINGKKAVEERYNWKAEEGKLLEFYDRMI